MVGERFDEEILKFAVDHASKCGAGEVIGKLVEEKKHQIRFSGSSIDVNKEWTRYHLDLFLSKGRRFSLGKKINTLTLQDPDKEKAKKKIPKQVSLLDELPKSKLYWGMDEGSHRTYPDVNGLYDKKIKDFSDKAPELVKKTIRSSEDAGAEKVAGVLHFGSKKTGILTSYGNGGDYKSSHCRTTIRSFCQDESSGQDLVVTRDLSNIENRFERAGEKAGKLAKEGEGAREGDEGRYDMIMGPAVAANIFGNLLMGANPIMMVAGMSCLKGKMNDQIGPEKLTIVDDPLIEEGLNSRPFDDEGTPSQRTSVIKNGEFVELINNTSSAKFWTFMNTIKGRFWRRSKTTSNSSLGQIGMSGTEQDPRTLLPSPSNYRFKSGDHSLDELISSSNRPTIYLTSNWYTRFTNRSEGEFSTVPRDAAFLIEDGDIKHPVKNLRLTGNLLDICKNIEAIGEDLKQIRWWVVNTPTFVPHIKVRNCKFTRAKK